MKDFSQLSPEELNKMDKQVLITIIGALQGQLNAISSQLNFLTEQIALMNQRSFGRKTEKLEDIHQMTLFETFNEAEIFADSSKEPEITEIIVSSHARKKKTSREENLKGLPARIFEHVLSEEELKKRFPEGYKELPCETYKRLSIIPQTFLVDEHHVHVYASKNNDGTIIKADRPADLFRNSIATSSLVAAIVNGKFANHLPLERQSNCYKSNGVKLETNTMANWVMKSAEMYFSLVYDELHKQLFSSPVIHGDETPFEITNDGRKAGSKSYMWVYCNGDCQKEKPVIIYDYEATRRTDHPDDFLKNYSGVLVTDGYQVYHSLEKQRDDLQVAGCWIHTKRKFAEVVKTTKDFPKEDQTIAGEATRRIAELFHLDKPLHELSKEEREKERQRLLKPKVDDFFAWAKLSLQRLPGDSETAKGLRYCLNQEKFLRLFLSNGDVPMDNNLAERAIRPFTLGRKNWVNMNSVRGAEASAILYSIVETAKVNNLRVYEYLEYLLEELSRHAEDTNRDFMTDLMPWSEPVQQRCRKIQK